MHPNIVVRNYIRDMIRRRPQRFGFCIAWLLIRSIRYYAALRCASLYAKLMFAKCVIPIYFLGTCAK